MKAIFLSFLSLFLINHASDERDPLTDKPNIIFILVDDLGWGNVGYHNPDNDEIHTPNIDYLVENGLQLNRHYVDAECSPTRSSFQSGRLPVHVNTNNNDGILDSTMGVHPDMTCIASKLKEAGYSTHMVGKWDCGFASFRQIPINRGYDTYYGYLGKSIDYYSKNGDAICSKLYVDLWEDDHPAYDSIDEVDSGSFVENQFKERVLNTIEAASESEEADPFFIFYSSHLPHYPSQLPPDCIANGIYTDFDDDEAMCAAGNDMVSFEYTRSADEYRCRSILQAQVHVLDDIVGEIKDKLVATDLWDNTLIVFSTDNGGSLELSLTAGNNYPLRGGKASQLEGGIRGTAFVSGGYLPETQRGQLTNGLMHIADWYTTFSEMLGVESADSDAEDLGLPATEGFNMWPLISGETDESPRVELIMGKNVLIHNQWKLIVGGSTKYAIWQESKWPNSNSPTQAELMQTYLKCDVQKNWGCLFNVELDPSERNDLADAHPDKVENMRTRLKQLKNEFWASSFAGELSCPEGFHDDGADDIEYVSLDLEKYNLHADVATHSCGCWMSQHNYNLFSGPFMDVPDEYISFDEGSDLLRAETDQKQEYEKSSVGVFSMLDIGNLQDFQSNIIIYMSLSVATVILLVLSCRNCKKTKERKQKKEELEQVASYGTV